MNKAQAQQSSLEQWTNSNKRVNRLSKGQYRLYKMLNAEAAIHADKYARSLGRFSMVYGEIFVIVKMDRPFGMFLHPLASYDYLHESMTRAREEQGDEQNV